MFNKKNLHEAVLYLENKFFLYLQEQISQVFRGVEMQLV